MSRVEEIEQAVERLTPDDLRRFREWFHERDQHLWDEELHDDNDSGTLDFLFEEADSEATARALREWPPTK